VRKFNVSIGIAVIGLLIVCLLASCSSFDIYDLLLEDGSSDSGVMTEAAASPEDDGPLPPSALLTDVTYTFYPRLRGTKEGLDVDSWLDKIVVRGQFMNLYFTNQPVGKGNGSAGAGNFHHDLTIQDLDNPARSYDAVGTREDGAAGAMIVTFENVTAKRFNFTNTAYGGIGLYFDEIVLGDPDPDLGLTTLQNGTYTYYPRPQAMRDGQDVDFYLNKIVVRSGFTNLYFVDQADGVGRGGSGGGNLHHWKMIQDLDHPQLTWNAIDFVEDRENRGYIVTFENVTAKRFSFLNNAYGRDLLLFEEIIVGDPDEGTGGSNSVVNIAGTHNGINVNSAGIGGDRISRGRPKDGTYTFYPRLRGMKDGLYVNSYIDKVVVNGSNLNVYFTNQPIGTGDGSAGAGNFHHDKVLQDLDNPARSYDAVANREDSGSMVVSYENVVSNRFSFTNTAYGEVGVYFEEITLGEPDPVLSIPPLQNGTYTFYPRPRAMTDGLDVNVYLDKITVRGEYMNLFFVDRPDGKGSGGLGAGNLHHWKLIQDLDYPYVAYNATGFTEDRESGGYAISFQNVNSRRFSFTNTAYGEVGFVFEEIIIGEPDL
jgi:hypothetical protein